MTWSFRITKIPNKDVEAALDSAMETCLQDKSQDEMAQIMQAEQGAKYVLRRDACGLGLVTVQVSGTRDDLGGSHVRIDVGVAEAPPEPTE